MQTNLQSLIDRMTAKEAVTSSEQSVSWQAHREAEQLTDGSLIDELERFLAKSKSKDARRAAYFILGAIGVNTGAVRCAETLVHHLALETDKHVLHGLLDALANLHKPEALELEPVFRLLHESRWLVRHAAITALKNSASSAAEDQVLAHLARTDDPYDKIYCHATLNQIGTPRAIPQIRLGLTSRTRDVKMSAEEAIRAIEDRHAHNAA